MATTAPHQQPTPERFFNAINAYEQTEAMKAAVELEIFTAIDEGNTTAATIAKRCEAAERGVRTLCDFLTIHGSSVWRRRAHSFVQAHKINAKCTKFLKCVDQLPQTSGKTVVTI